VTWLTVQQVATEFWGCEDIAPGGQTLRRGQVLPLDISKSRNPHRENGHQIRDPES